MAIRTTSDAVKLLMAPGKDYDTNLNPSLAPFIESANALVDDIEANATANGLSIDATRLELIERWLAAHDYKQSDQQYAQNSTESAQASYQGKTGMGLLGTKYGQKAVNLDKTGYLLRIASETSGDTVTRRTASALWLGKRRSQQIPYVDRS